MFFSIICVVGVLSLVAERQVVNFNFVSKRADYVAKLAMSDLLQGESMDVYHSFALNKTMIFHQKSGGGEVAQD